MYKKLTLDNLTKTELEQLIDECSARTSEHPEKECAECKDRNWWNDEYKG